VRKEWGLDQLNPFRILISQGFDIFLSMESGNKGHSELISRLAPLQDLLSLDSDARMNFPGRPSGNWYWRVLSSDINTSLQQRLLEMNYLYGRLPEKRDLKGNQLSKSLI
jgi:hypothetical protein